MMVIKFLPILGNHLEEFYIDKYLLLMMSTGTCLHFSTTVSITSKLSMTAYEFSKLAESNAWRIYLWTCLHEWNISYFYNANMIFLGALNSNYVNL